MMTNGKITAAAMGGYLLGRTRKGKLALSLAMMLAGRRLSLNPRNLSKLVADSTLLSGLSDQVRKDLVEGTKSAAGSALEARMGSLADSLSDRTRALQDGESGGDEDGGEAEAAEKEEPDAEKEEPDAEKEEPDAEEQPSRARGGARRGASSAARHGGKASGTAGKTSRTAGRTARTAKTAGAGSARRVAHGGGDE
jgi:hypothetical protein